MLLWEEHVLYQLILRIGKTLPKTTLGYYMKHGYHEKSLDRIYHSWQSLYNH